MPTIFLIRHAESQSNAGLPTSCPAKIELTKRGAEQTECIANFFFEHLVPLNLIVTSSYLRTKQTAASTKKRFPSVPEEVWPVQEFTYLSSMHEENSTVEYRRPLVDAYWEQGDPRYVDGPGSESFASFIKRVRAVIVRLTYTTYESIALFSHEQFITAVLWLSQYDPPIDMRPRAWDVGEVSSQMMRDFRVSLKTFRTPNGAIWCVQIPDAKERWAYEPITSHLKMEEPLAVGRL